MHSYLIDELTSDQTQSIIKQLNAMDLHSGMDGLYFLPIPERMYSKIQQEHAKECGPYIMSLEIDEDFLRLELLVRSKNILNCSCVNYAAPELEQYMMRYVDSLLRQD